MLLCAFDEAGSPKRTYMCHVSCPGLTFFVGKIYDADRSRWNLVTDVIGKSTWAAVEVVIGLILLPTEISLRLLIIFKVLCCLCICAWTSCGSEGRDPWQ